MNGGRDVFGGGVQSITKEAQNKRTYIIMALALGWFGSPFTTSSVSCCKDVSFSNGAATFARDVKSIKLYEANNPVLRAMYLLHQHHIILLLLFLP